LGKPNLLGGEIKTVFLTKKLPLLGGVLLIAALALMPFVRAQDQPDTATGGNGLQMSPTRSEVSADPGQTKQFSLTLRNVTQGDLVAQAVVNDFESDGVSGTPQIIVDENQRTPYSINNFLRGLQDVEIKAGEVKEVKLSLEVPDNAVPGAYFGVVRFAAVPKEEQSESERQVSLTASVAHIVLLEVAGDVTEQIQLESLKPQRDNDPGSFFLNPPDSMALGVKNLGNGFARPFGTVAIKNIIGKEVKSYEVNNTTPKGVILPNSSRTFVDGIDGVNWPGRYTATAAVAYGNGGEVVTYNSAFWYIPLWLLITLIALLAAAAYYLRRKYNKRFGTSKRRR
jgi:hypothetical protein